jgi:signal transduction histidine kinase/DNA-binding response OmpR family regulator
VDTLLTVALQGAFFAVFAAVAMRYVRRRTPLNRDLLAVFASVAGLFLLTIVNQLIDGPAWLGSVSGVLLMAQPFLAVRLVKHFAALPRWVVALVFIAFLGAAALIVRGIAGDRVGLLLVVSYFALANAIAAVAFFLAARDRIGVARVRLVVAGVATLLFGACILVAGAGAAVEDGSSNTPNALAVAARVVALLAGLGYLVAFATPRWLRRIQQQAVAFRLDEELLSGPPGTDATASWGKLAAAARRVMGARAALVIADDHDGTILGRDGGSPGDAPAGSTLGGPLDAPVRPSVQSGAPAALASVAGAVGAGTTVLVPLEGAVSRRGTLAILVAGSPLFVDDDLGLLGTLAARTMIAIEREEALADRSALISTLRRTNEELARASAAKTDFLAAMSHELRTPLNAIIGFSEMLMAPVGDVGRRGLDVVDHAGHIHGAGLQLLDLINEVLDLARVEAGRLEMHREAFDLGTLVRRTLESMRPLADRRGIRVEVDSGGSIELDADPNRIRQVIYNLVSNAIKFSAEGGTVRVVVGSDDSHASVAVQDEGPGIPAAEQGLVFEAFSQGAAGRTRTDGAGLGLALSRQLAEAHGGSIELESMAGHGSTFTLRIPLQAPEPAPAAARRDGRRLVLIVEDDPGSVALLRSWLEPEGYAIAVAADGEAGLHSARTLMPDAIILDILLPGLDGWDVLQQLRVERRTRSIPILIVSVVEDRQLGLALGAADYFVKPVDREPLLERLRWATRARQGDAMPVVLAIDADDDAHAAYRSVLDGAARLLSATTAEAALRLVREAPPDAILLDLGLTDGSPFALVAELKRAAVTREVPIFALTRHPLSEDDKRRLTGQVVAVLEKEDAARGLATWLGDVPVRSAAGVGASLDAAASP